MLIGPSQLKSCLPRHDDALECSGGGSDQRHVADLTYHVGCVCIVVVVVP